ncbi:MAG: hypothetical protein AVDCRST_MAG64-1006 [uncultured Phycisphaerae bacterium]|uniref:DUF3368 domain-containing protein n=1 Tax=uncultured Phycisphaerae bacterium TaxID=904963 RepID=A0A6J4NJS0_9BACT|nr:MAG: hypothetical protein AVDCRST_MAG64-1006 [uncultured Phycisphaerae bacterium]
MHTVVVSDTSPVRCLHHLGLVDVLGELFGSVIVPPAVRQELLQPRPRFRAIDVASYEWASVRAPADVGTVTGLAATFGPGEAEAIVLAAELGAELLIDEAAGRAEAKRRRLRTVGVAGVLVRAKQRGIVPAVVPLVERLRDELGFFVGQAFLNEVRRRAGE